MEHAFLFASAIHGIKPSKIFSHTKKIGMFVIIIKTALDKAPKKEGAATSKVDGNPRKTQRWVWLIAATIALAIGGIYALTPKAAKEPFKIEDGNIFYSEDALKRMAKDDRNSGVEAQIASANQHCNGEGSNLREVATAIKKAIQAKRAELLARYGGGYIPKMVFCEEVRKILCRLECRKNLFAQWHLGLVQKDELPSARKWENEKLIWLQVIVQMLVYEQSAYFPELRGFKRLDCDGAL